MVSFGPPVGGTITAQPVGSNQQKAPIIPMNRNIFFVKVFNLPIRAKLLFHR
jgi:hypothetical protein